MLTPRQYRLGFLAIVVTFLGFAALDQLRLAAQPGGAGGAPDVIVGDIPAIRRWGSLGNETAFSLATTSCNIGTARLDWIPSPDPRHPVITQNLYRILDGRIEQLGIMSWLKHGFSVAAGSLCGNCGDHASHYLAVNCSDPYSESLNGLQGGLGPRREINASTGAYSMPFSTLPTPRTILDGRLRVANVDLDPAGNLGARYFVESQYIHPQDAAAGNGLNNASYREAFVRLAPSGELHLNLAASAPIVRESPAIKAWRHMHPDVSYVDLDVPGDGRFIVGYRFVPNAGSVDGHTILAVMNLNSHRSARSLRVRFADGAIANPGFHDIAYQHEPYSGTDWAVAVNGSEIEWSTDSFTTSQNANALRWGAMYTFWCDSASPPTSLQLGLFRPGGTETVGVDLDKQVQPDAAALDPTTDWALVEDSVHVGAVSTDHPATFGVTCRYGLDRVVKSVSASGEEIEAAAQPEESAKGRAWTVTVTPDVEAPEGYFESVVTLVTDNPTDQTVRVRVFGEIVK